MSKSDTSLLTWKLWSSMFFFFTFSIWIWFGQRIPLWWRWYYWANPVAWTLYGLLVSQYGDDEREVKLSDGVHKVMVKQLLEEVMGYKHDFLGVSAIMVVAFCVFFSVVFAFSIKTFNFQRRWWLITTSFSQLINSFINIYLYIYQTEPAYLFICILEISYPPKMLGIAA